MSENGAPAAGGPNGHGAGARLDPPQRTFSQRGALGIAVVAMLLGAGLGALGARLDVGGDDTPPLPALFGQPQPVSVPSGPLAVTGGTRPLDQGFSVEEEPGAALIVIVRRGGIEVEGAGPTRELDPGELAVAAPDQEVRLRGREDGSVVDVIRIGPPPPGG